MVLPIIYCFIPSRLDRELIPTCYDLLNKADNANNIEIVVFNQDREDDMFKQSQFPPQVTLINVDYNKFSNICWIRSLAQYFVKPQHTHYLSIDSHMRFDKGWDTILLNALKPNSVLSAYPPGYSLYSPLPQNTKHHRNCFNIERNGPFPFVSDIQEVSGDYLKSTIAGGFHFSTIDWLEKVGYDKHLCWKWEEIDLTYRTINEGYDIINYKHTPIYHLYDHTMRKLQDHQEVFLTDCDTHFLQKTNTHSLLKISEYYDINFEDFVKNLT